MDNDAYLIYSSDALLAVDNNLINNITRGSIHTNDANLLEADQSNTQQFTINSDNYQNFELASSGYLKEFALKTNSVNNYLIKEQGFTVSKEGLVINNEHHDVIIIQSTGKYWLNLFGPIQISGKQAELVLLSDYKINCNGCSFPGIERVILCSNLPSVGLATKLYQLIENYCHSSSTQGQVVIGRDGIFSTSISLIVGSGDFINKGIIWIDRLKIHTSDDININQDIHANGDSTAIELRGKNINMQQVDILANNNIELIAKLKIVNYAQLESNNLIKIITDGAIENHNLIHSLTVDLKADYLNIFKGSIEAQQLLKAILSNQLNIYPDASLKSYGRLEASGVNGQLMNHFQVTSGSLIVKDNAIIRAKLFINHYDSTMQLITEDIPNYKAGEYHHHKGKIDLTIQECSKQRLVGNAKLAKTMIGGDLSLVSDRIDNDYAQVAIAGKTHFDNLQVIINSRLDLITKAVFHCAIPNFKARYAQWCAAQAQEGLNNHCDGLNSQGLQGIGSNTVTRVDQKIGYNEFEYSNKVELGNPRPFINKELTLHNHFVKLTPKAPGVTSLANKQTSSMIDNQAASNSYIKVDLNGLSTELNQGVKQNAQYNY